MILDKRILNFLVIVVLTFATFWWTFFIFHMQFELNIVLSIIVIRMFASLLIFKDYSLSWSKATQKTFLIKSFVYIASTRSTDGTPTRPPREETHDQTPLDTSAQPKEHHRIWAN